MKSSSTKYSPVLAIAITLVLFVGQSAAQRYNQTNLRSDLPIASNPPAGVPDSDLVNPWGLARSSGSPWWVADNGTGVSTLYDGTGVKQGLRVTIPGLPPAPGQPPATSTPSGAVFNGTSDFAVAPGDPAIFIFATEDGTISGWNPSVDRNNAILKVNESPKAVFKGLARASVNGVNYLYAANFRSGHVEVFDTNFIRVKLGGDPHNSPFVENAFQDERLPDGYAPFNVQNIAGNLIVTFALQDSAKHDQVDGAGNGFVDVFSPNGRLLRRFQHGDWLNAPWGVTLTPGDFGKLSHMLLVGQFGSGEIAAYDPFTLKFVGKVLDANGAVLNINRIWSLSFGAGNANSGSATTLFFTAGIFDENHGLFGTLTPILAELKDGNSN